MRTHRVGDIVIIAHPPCSAAGVPFPDMEELVGASAIVVDDGELLGMYFASHAAGGDYYDGWWYLAEDLIPTGCHVREEA